MSTVQQAIRALRLAVRSGYQGTVPPLQALAFPLDSTGEDGSQYTSSSAVFACVEPFLYAVGLTVLPADYEPLPDGFVMAVSVHCQGETLVFRRVWKWRPGDGLCQAGAQTECLRALYLDLVAMRTPHVEAPKRARPEPTNGAAQKPDKLAEKREFVRQGCVVLARHAVPGAVERMSWIDTANAEGVNRSVEWVSRELAKLAEKNAQTAQAPISPATQPSETVSEVPTVIDDEAKLGAPEERGQSAVLPPSEPPAEPPSCSACGMEALHVQREGRCRIACSFCRCKSATLYYYVGKAPKGQPRPKKFRCPDCADEQIPKGAKLKAVEEGWQPAAPMSEEQKEQAAAALSKLEALTASEAGDL